MTIDDIFKYIFSKRDFEWHCKDLDSIAMAEFNVACPFGMPFSEPIVDIKEACVNGNLIVNTVRDYKNKEWVKIVFLINSNEPKDVDKCLTVRQIIEKLKQFDGASEVCSINKNRDINSCSYICAFIGVHDGTDNIECEKHNISKDYKGFITNFLI